MKNATPIIIHVISKYKNVINYPFPFKNLFLVQPFLTSWCQEPDEESNTESAQCDT